MKPAFRIIVLSLRNLAFVICFFVLLMAGCNVLNQLMGRWMIAIPGTVAVFFCILFAFLEAEERAKKRKRKAE